MPVCGLSVREINRQSELETAWIYWMVKGGEIFLSAEQPLVQVAVHHKKSGLLQLEVGICVHQRIVADEFFMLGVERHCGWLVSRSVVACIVAAVHTEVDVQHSGNLEMEVQVAVDRQFGQRQHLFLA